MIPVSKRIIDLTIGELVEFLDERYGKNSRGKIIQTTAALKEPEFINVKQCASQTGYTPDYIRQLVFKRAIPFYKVRRALRFKPTEILDWMSSDKHTPINQLADEHINGNKPVIKF